MPEQKNGPLRRKLGLLALLSIVVANMIGSGIFTLSGLLMAELKNPLVLLMLWVVGGSIALCGALVYSELGCAMPEAGGEYVFLSRLYHPMVGFLSGWVSFFVGFSAPIAASAIGFSEYMANAVPPNWKGLDWFFNPMGRKALAVAIIMLFSLVHIRGIKASAKTQNWLTALKIGLIISLVTAGFIWGNGSWSHFRMPDVKITTEGWKGTGFSLIWIMFAYSGWNASTYLGAEIYRPFKNIPRSLLFGTLIVMVLYLLLNVLFVYAIPPNEMEGVIAIGSVATQHLFGASFKPLFSLVIAIALFSSVSAFIILGPRVYYAMAGDGLFFRFAADVSARYGVPVKSILLQSVVSAIMVMTGTFEQILTFMGFSLSIFPLLAVIGIFKVRKQMSLSYRHPGFPIVPMFFILSVSAMMVLTFAEKPLESSVSLIIVLLGIPAYVLFKRKR